MRGSDGEMTDRTGNGGVGSLGRRPRPRSFSRHLGIPKKTGKKPEMRHAEKRLEVVCTFRMAFLCGGASLDCGDSSPLYAAPQHGDVAISAPSRSPETSSAYIKDRSKAAKNRRSPKTLRVGKAKPRLLSLSPRGRTAVFSRSRSRKTRTTLKPSCGQGMMV